MEQQPDKKDMQSRVLAMIDEGAVSMRPKLYFSLQVAMVALAAFLVFLFSTGIANFILFSIRISGHDVLLSFGPRGLSAFLLFFPWTLLIFDIGAVALLSHLMRRFRFGYKTPVVYILLGAALSSALFGAVLDRATPFNDRLYVGAREHRLPPPLGDFYVGMKHEWNESNGLCRCTVVSIKDGTMTVVDTRDASSTYTVLLPRDDVHATTSGISVGDTVMIAGDVDDSGVLHAFGIRFEQPGGMPSGMSPTP